MTRFSHILIALLSSLLWSCTGADISDIRSIDGLDESLKTPVQVAGINLLECKVFYNSDDNEDSEVACRVIDNGQILELDDERLVVNGITIRTKAGDKNTEAPIAQFSKSNHPEWTFRFPASKEDVDNIDEILATVIIDGESSPLESATILPAGAIATISIGLISLDDIALNQTSQPINVKVCSGQQDNDGNCTYESLDGNLIIPKVEDFQLSDNLAYAGDGQFPGNTLPNGCVIENDRLKSADCVITVKATPKKLNSDAWVRVNYDRGPNIQPMESKKSLPNLMRPTRVIGQDSLSSALVNRSGNIFTAQQNSLHGPQAIALNNGKLYIADTQNNRVSVFNRTAAQTSSALFILGQDAYADRDPNKGLTSASLDSMAFPSNLFFYNDYLYTSDRENDRVIMRDGADHADDFTTSYLSADVPAGKATSSGSLDGKFFMTSSTGEIFFWDALPHQPAWNASQNYKLLDIYQNGSVLAGKELKDITHASAVTLSNGQKRFIATDLGGNRVLIWNNLPSASGAISTSEPSIVLGQQDFTGLDDGQGLNELKTPSQAMSDGKRLFVADRGNNRILIWKSFPTTSGQAADIEITLQGMGDIIPLNTPMGMHIDTTNHELYIADTGNHRVLVFPLPDKDENW